MDEIIKTALAARASNITEWKANVERDREELRNARARAASAQLSLVESIRMLEDAQTSLYTIVRESFQ